MLKDITGMRFGRLIVVQRDDDKIEKSGRHRVMWKCKCDCGNTVSVNGENLRSGRTTSCGCYRVECTKKRVTTHGEADTPLYSIWCSIKGRCYNKNDAAYKHYGGRGIKMSQEWVNDFKNFRDWAYAHGYRQGLSIDRIDNNGIYESNNCQWVTSDVQANNRRSNVLITYNNETHNVTEWAKILGKNPKTIFSRLYTGWDPVEAIIT